MATGPRQCARMLGGRGPGEHCRSSAWICDFSSTQRTTAWSGGFMYSPTMSRTLSISSGSFDSLNVALRCGSGFKSLDDDMFPRGCASGLSRVYQYVQNGTTRSSNANVGTAPGVTTTRTHPTSGDPGTSSLVTFATVRPLSRARNGVSAMKWCESP
jgi:hypothetical protein